MRGFALVTLFAAVGCNSLVAPPAETASVVDDSSSVEVSAGPSSGLTYSAVEAESSWVETVELTCDGERETLTFDVDTSRQVVFRDLSSCTIKLLTFVVVREGQATTFLRTSRMSEGLPVFDPAGAEGPLGAKLVSEASTFVQGCAASCRGGIMKARFVYSELLAETISLEHPRLPPSKPRCDAELEIICGKASASIFVHVRDCRLDGSGVIEVGVSTSKPPRPADAWANVLIDESDYSFDPAADAEFALDQDLVETLLGRPGAALTVALRYAGQRQVTIKTLRTTAGPKVGQSPVQGDLCGK